MFETIMFAGALSAIGFILIAIKMGRTWLRRLLGYDIYFDVIITIGFMFFMAGTYAGAMVAIISGIIISISLWITKFFIGSETLRITKQGEFIWIDCKEK